jgi:hypothetical protein
MIEQGDRRREKDMKKSLYILAAFLLLGAISAFAEETTCESIDNRREECTLNTRSRVYINSQLSNAPCIENQTWGYTGNSIWVSDGCRAVFTYDDGNPDRGSAFPGSGNEPGNGSFDITCESIDNSREECTIATRRRVRIISQLSNAPCIEGQTWGYLGNVVWVSNGCRAVFGSDFEDPGWGSAFPESGNQPGSGPAEITCESVENRREECTITTSGRVRIVRRLSNAPCIEGQTWGYSANSVWVSDGCRAVFASDASSSSARGSRPPDPAIRACNDFRNRYGWVVSSTNLRNGFWEITLRYDDGEYVCTVGEGGDFSSFRKR